MSPDQIVIALASVTAIASVAIALAAWIQLPLIRRQMRIEGDRQKQWATVAACARYITDPVLREAKRNIWQARDHGKKDVIEEPDQVRQDVYILLNYLDNIAIGVNQHIYDETFVRDYLRYVFEDAVSRFIKKRSGDFKVKEEHFSDLLDLYEKWFSESAKAKAAP